MCLDTLEYSKTASAHRQIHVHQRVYVNTNNKTDLQHANNTSIRHIHIYKHTQTIGHILTCKKTDNKYNTGISGINHLVRD